MDCHAPHVGQFIASIYMSEFRDQSFTGSLLKALRFGNKVRDERYVDTVFPDTALGDFPDTSATLPLTTRGALLQGAESAQKVPPKREK
jgi:hypothetical protein